jgi:hypothetical protein
MIVLAMLNLLFLLVGFLPGLRKHPNRRVAGDSTTSRTSIE